MRVALKLEKPLSRRTGKSPPPQPLFTLKLPLSLLSACFAICDGRLFTVSWTVGVILDADLHFQKHISFYLEKAGFFFYWIRSLPSQSDPEKVGSRILFSSPLDRCNSLFAALAKQTLTELPQSSDTNRKVSTINHSCGFSSLAARKTNKHEKKILKFGLLLFFFF